MYPRWRIILWQLRCISFGPEFSYSVVFLPVCLVLKQESQIRIKVGNKACIAFNLTCCAMLPTNGSLGLQSVRREHMLSSTWSKVYYFVNVLWNRVYKGDREYFWSIFLSWSDWMKHVIEEMEMDQRCTIVPSNIQFRNLLSYHW